MGERGKLTRILRDASPRESPAPAFAGHCVKAGAFAYSGNDSVVCIIAMPGYSGTQKG